MGPNRVSCERQRRDRERYADPAMNETDVERIASRETGTESRGEEQRTSGEENEKGQRVRHMARLPETPLLPTVSHSPMLMQVAGQARWGDKRMRALTARQRISELHGAKGDRCRLRYSSSKKKL
jgi:hypothetical protein